MFFFLPFQSPNEINCDQGNILVMAFLELGVCIQLVYHCGRQPLTLNEDMEVGAKHSKLLYKCNKMLFIA
jgi:hypothetical protein